MPLLARLTRPLLATHPPRTPRSFTTLTPLRPALRPLLLPRSRPPAAADVVPPSAVSAHPALAAQQLRFGPRNTMNGATRLVQKRRLGFLSRMRTKNGRKILMRRRLKGRKILGC